MKIYRNEKGQVVFDGDGITTIEVPQNVKGFRGIHDWLESRLVADGFTNFIVTGFTFKWPEIDGCIDLTTKVDFITT